MQLFCQERDRQKSKIEIEWQFLVNTFNIDEIERAREMAKAMGVYIRFSPMNGMEFHPDLQEHWLPKAGEAKWQAGKVDEGKTVYDWPCYFLWRSLIVNSNAKLARCLIYQNVAQYGNLHESSVMEIFNGPDSQRARQLFSRDAVAAGHFPAPCNNCSFYKREHGGPNLNKHESLLMPTSFEGKVIIPLEAMK